MIKKNKKEKSVWQIAHLIIKVILALFISFFKAITELVWGIAGIFLLAGLMVYFKVDMDISPLFRNMISFIISNTNWFILIFFAFYCYKHIKEVLQNDPSNN